SAKPLEGRMKAAAEGVAALIGSPSDERLGALAAPSLNQAALRSQLEPLRSSYGACSVAETISGDGATDVRVRLECARGPLEARLKADSDGKLIETSFARPAGSPCVP
ncbi:MAG: hypothetical protein WD733_07545, partial [Bryobacterales bacterium]